MSFKNKMDFEEKIKDLISEEAALNDRSLRNMSSDDKKERVLRVARMVIDIHEHARQLWPDPLAQASLTAASRISFSMMTSYGRILFDNGLLRDIYAINPVPYSISSFAYAGIKGGTGEDLQFAQELVDLGVSLPEGIAYKQNKHVFDKDILIGLIRNTVKSQLLASVLQIENENPWNAIELRDKALEGIGRLANDGNVYEAVMLLDELHQELNDASDNHDDLFLLSNESPSDDSYAISLNHLKVVEKAMDYIVCSDFTKALKYYDNRVFEGLLESGLIEIHIAERFSSFPDFFISQSAYEDAFNSQKFVGAVILAIESGSWNAEKHLDAKDAFDFYEQGNLYDRVIEKATAIHGDMRNPVRYAIEESTFLQDDLMLSFLNWSTSFVFNSKVTNGGLKALGYYVNFICQEERGQAWLFDSDEDMDKFRAIYYAAFHDDVLSFIPADRKLCTAALNHISESVVADEKLLSLPLFNSDVMRDIISEADAGMVIKIIENHPQWELPREVGKKTSTISKKILEMDLGI